MGLKVNRIPRNEQGRPIWETIEFPDAHYYCPECNEACEAKEMVWASEHLSPDDDDPDPNPDGWYCQECAGPAKITGPDLATEIERRRLEGQQDTGHLACQTIPQAPPREGATRDEGDRRMGYGDTDE